MNYSGAIVTFYYNRQALGTYKCCTNVYSLPVRAYVFDTDFLDPTLLPPGTPMFRDVNIMGFTYNIRAEQLLTSANRPYSGSALPEYSSICLVRSCG